MANLFDDALALSDWLVAAPSAEVIDRIQAAERDAFLWHCVELHLSPDEVERFKQIAAKLRAAGYKKP